MKIQAFLEWFLSWDSQQEFQRIGVNNTNIAGDLDRVSSSDDRSARSIINNLINAGQTKEFAQSVVDWVLARKAEGINTELSDMSQAQKNKFIDAAKSASLRQRLPQGWELLRIGEAQLSEDSQHRKTAVWAKFSTPDGVLEGICCRYGDVKLPIDEITPLYNRQRLADFCWDVWQGDKTK